MIKPEVLVAWLETEGWMRVRINPKNNYIDAEIGISQKEIPALEKLISEIEDNPSRLRVHSRRQISWNFPRLDSILKILDEAKAEDWFTSKYQDYKYFKDAVELIKEVRSRKSFVKWKREDVKKLLEIRSRMKHVRNPRNKLSDEEILQGWSN